MAKVGWLVNDQLGALAGVPTLWERLLTWLPGLEDRTGGYTPFGVLADTIEAAALRDGYPDYVIRNGTYFPPMRLLTTKQITLIQDIAYSAGRAYQVQTGRNAAMTVFNSGYTRDQYPELCAYPHRIIPLGTDFSHFRPLHARAALRDKYGLPATGSIVCFIGALSAIKGIVHLQHLIAATPYHYVLVLKDTVPVDAQLPARVSVFEQVPHATLVEIINACDVGVCTSVRETQHLAGIEIGACDVPMVAPDIGIYYDQPTDGPWGMRGEINEFPQLLHRCLTTPRAPRAYWETTAVTLDACREAWIALVADVVGQ